MSSTISKRGRKSAKSKYVKESMAKLEQMMKERKQHARELDEMKARRALHEETMKAEVRKQELNPVLQVLSTTLPEYAENHPGKEVFLESKRYQLFNVDELISSHADYESCLKVLRAVLQLKMLPSTTALSKWDTKLLFYLMSSDRDFIVSESCYHYLRLHHDQWVPKLKDFINVLTNWGATYQTLDMTDEDIAIVYPHNVPRKKSTPNDAPEFCGFNYEYVFSYLKSVIENSNPYSDAEILLLLKTLIVVSLDKRNYKISDTLRGVGLISVCVESMKDWDTARIVDTTKYIYNEKDSFHNQIAVATTILPRFSRCRDIRSCLSFTILRKMILGKTNFTYPQEDEVLWELIQNIKTNDVSKEELSELYLVVYLIHSIVRASNMILGESAVLEKIEKHLVKLRRNVSLEYQTFDADLLRGRIDLCIAMWQLLGTIKDSPDCDLLSP